MPYPTRPAAPRESWVPDPHCESAKAALVRQYDESEARCNRHYDWLIRLTDEVCRDANTLRLGGTNNNPEECIAGIEKLCELLHVLSVGWAKRLHALELAVMDAIDAIDCNASDWRERFDEAVGLWQTYNSLVNDLAGDVIRMKAWWDALKWKCPNFYHYIPSGPVPGATGLTTPYYDGFDGWLTGGGGPAHAPAPCDCGSP